MMAPMWAALRLSDQVLRGRASQVYPDKQSTYEPVRTSHEGQQSTPK